MTQQFSVSMCVYGKDNPQWFRQAVDSVLNQTVRPTELVLVVDGPIQEELNRVVADYEKRPEFRVIRLPENVGHGNARRIGLENCSYELVALMDADDISTPDRFEKQLKKFRENPELSVVGGNITEFLDRPDNIVGARVVETTDAAIKADLRKRCPMNQMSVMFKKIYVQQAGGYMDWYCNEDYYLWIRMVQNKMQFANTEEYLVNVRVGQEMYQRRGGWKYFASEAKLQKYMLDNRVIGFGTFLINMAKRLVIQVLLPNRIRSWVFQKFARKQVS